MKDDNGLLAINEHKIKYKIINAGKDAPEKTFLVFLHDGLGSIKQWKDFPKTLSSITGLPALVYDRFGYGESGKLLETHKPDYFKEEAVKVLPEILKSLDINGEIILIGHSDGGSIALIYVSKFPGKVKGLITEAAHVFTEEVTLEGIRNAVYKYEKGDFKNYLSKYHSNNTENMFNGWSSLWLDKDFRDWNIKSSLNKIKCPLLAMQGDNDEYGTLEQLRLIINGTSGPTDSFIIKNCGHIPHHQAREFVLENMKRFILKIL
ncbi:MAG: alpha/beta hydrolase [Ignavibacteria bacterium]|nr:alpha/beta hydrolase [Ignavibacteria bacterium]